MKAYDVYLSQINKATVQKIILFHHNCEFKWSVNKCNNRLHVKDDGNACEKFKKTFQTNLQSFHNYEYVCCSIDENCIGVSSFFRYKK